MEKDRTKHSNSAAFSDVQTHSDKGFYDVVPQSASFDENCFVRDFNMLKPKENSHDQDGSSTLEPKPSNYNQDGDPTLKPWNGPAILLMDLDAFL